MANLLKTLSAFRMAGSLATTMVVVTADWTASATAKQKADLTVAETENYTAALTVEQKAALMA